MDANAASAPGLISSLELMIQASVNSVLDRRLGLAAETLDAHIQAAVAATLDKRLIPAVGSLGNRMTALIEQRLGNAVSIVDHQVNTALTAALEQRLGPAGSALTAQITFMAAPIPVSPSEPPAKAEGLGEVKRTNAAKGELTTIQPTGKEGAKEKEQTTEQQNVVELESSEMPTPESGDKISVSATNLEKTNQSTSKETGTVHLEADQNSRYPLVVDSASKSKSAASDARTAKASPTSQRSSSNAERTPAKRKVNQKDEANKADDPGESDSLSSEEEGNNEKPKIKRPKVKLVPPGYTEGPAIRFRKISSKLTASAQKRGFPRVIDLECFTEASNKENFTIADVVATLLFNYHPLSLDAFIDLDKYPTFHFVRKESDQKARNFVIERRRESYGVVMKCGYHLSQVERTMYHSDDSRIWETKYEYIILPVGRWVASHYMQDPSVSNSSKKTIEQWATEFGTNILLGKLWVEGPEAKIESDGLVLLYKDLGKSKDSVRRRRLQTDNGERFSQDTA